MCDPRADSLSDPVASYDVGKRYAFDFPGKSFPDSLQRLVRIRAAY